MDSSLKLLVQRILQKQDAAPPLSCFPCEWKPKFRVCPGDLPDTNTHTLQNTHTWPHPQTPPDPGTTHPTPPALHCPPPLLCFPLWPLIAFMPLFSQCEKFDNVHKRNSRTAAGYGKSTCGSSLPPLCRRLGICSFILLFWTEKDVTVKGPGPTSNCLCLLQELNFCFLGLVVLQRAIFSGPTHLFLSLIYVGPGVTFLLHASSLW